MGKEEGSADIGARLRAARERKGLTVLQSAEKLHMDARLLEALESGDFASLGAAVYVRGHLRRYAELVGESVAELQALYAGATPAATPDLTRIPRAGHSPESSQLLLPAMVAVVVLALAGVVWWLVSLPGKTHPPPVAAQPLTVPVPASAGAGPAASATDRSDSGTSAPTASAPTATAPAPVAPDGQVHLALKFAEASWIKIWDASDKALLDGLMASGTSRTVDGTAPVRLVIGNARAVGLAINGQLVNLDSMVRRRGDARITVDAGGQVSAGVPSARGE
jgi:cytoskeleton protein RodZ